MSAGERISRATTTMIVNGRFEKLLEPSKIGKLHTRNRIIKTGAGTCYANDGWVSSRHKAYYEALARGGVGLLIIEKCEVDYPLSSDMINGSTIRIDDDKFIPSLRELAEVIHKHRCPTFVQFYHIGLWHDSKMTGMQAISSSCLTEKEMPKPDVEWYKYVPCREMTLADIERVIDCFASAAERAKKAGFDGVELNGATNHLINSFFSRIYNKRHDKFGCDSLENRSRFMTEIIHAIKKRLGNDFPVSTLINGAEFGHPLGTTLEECKGFSRILEAAGADAIQIRPFGYGEFEHIIWPESIFFPEPPKLLPKELDTSRHGAGLAVPLATEVKKVVSIPVITVGRLNPALGEQILREKRADFIGMTRRLVADPELPNKIAAGKLDDIAPCTACTHCISLDGELKCRINAAVGGDADYLIKPAVKKKKVLVIGGGPAGMEAARVAAIKGHQVTLIEKQPVLGGLIPLAGLVKGLEIEDLEGLIKYLKTQIKKLGVDIILGKEFRVSLISKLKPDAVILAVGGVATTVDVPGIDRKNVIILSHLDKTLRPFLRIFGMEFVRWATNFYMPGGKNTIVLGGTFYGCELAEFLVKRGKKVTIVHTGAPETLGEGMPIGRMWPLLEWLTKKGVTFITGAKYNEINDKGLVIVDNEGKTKTIKANTIMPSTLLMPNTELLKLLKGKVTEIYPIGDCHEPHMIIDAVSNGYHVANAL